MSEREPRTPDSPSKHRRRSPRRRWRWGLTALAVALLTGVAPTASAASTGLRAADDGARVLTQRRLDVQTMDVTMHSPALGRDTTMRLLLPPGWSPNATRSWPVVYLLPGCCDGHDYTAWTAYTDVKRFVQNKNVIVALPSEGVNGSYSNWWNYGKWGTPNWEKFHLDEMRQILERNYHASTQRAIAGLSAGGYGAMEYATRRPGMFQAAASFSGLLNILAPDAPLWTLYGNVRTHQPPFALWGNSVLQRPIWRAHNPYDHVDNLRGTRLFVSAGNGQHGPYDANTLSGGTVFGVATEMGSYTNSLQFTNKLRRHGIPVTTDYYDSDTHSWPYWQRELHRAWPLLTKGFSS